MVFLGLLDQRTHAQVCSIARHRYSGHKLRLSRTEIPCSSVLLPDCMCTSYHSVPSATNPQPITHSRINDHCGLQNIVCYKSLELFMKVNYENFIISLILILSLEEK